MCSLFCGAISRLELMLAQGHSDTRAAGHFRPAILSGCDTMWSVMWHFDQPLYMSLGSKVSIYVKVPVVASMTEVPDYAGGSTCVANT